MKYKRLPQTSKIYFGIFKVLGLKRVARPPARIKIGYFSKSLFLSPHDQI